MSNKPILELKTSSLSLSIWENEATDTNGEKYTVYSLKPTRSYKDKAGNWQNTDSLRLRDALPMAELLRLAFEKLSVKERAPQEAPSRDADDASDESDKSY